MDPYEQQDTLDLRDYLAVLRRQTWLIAATVVVVVVTAMIVTMLQTPLYQSTVELVVEPFDRASDQSALEQALLGNTELQTQRKLVASIPVAERVIEDLGLDRTPQALLDSVDVDVVTDTQVLEITATDEDPELAAALAGSVAESYLADRRDEALERVLSATRSLEERAQTIRSRIDELADQIEARQAEEAPVDAASPAAGETEASDLDALREERDSLLTQLGQVTAQLSTFESRDALVRGGGEVIRPADVPDSPASPKPLRTGILALVLGLMLGVGLAFLRDFLDDAIRSDDDAVRAARAPVLAHIPYRAESDQDKRLATLVDEFSPKAEAFRTLRSNVRFVLYGGAPQARGESAVGRSLTVTSAVATEGKTTTAANLAVAAARAGTKVLLVDADLRRPGIAKAFGIENAPGLSELLVGEVSLRDVVSDVGVANLRILTSGAIPPNPAELLAGSAMRALHLRLEQIAELIVYDTAPVLAVADTLEVAPISTQTMIVVDVREASRRTVRHTADKLRGVGGEVAGTVLNNVTPGDRYYYSYSSYDYSPEPQPEGGSASEAWSASRVSRPAVPPQRPSSRPARKPRFDEPPADEPLADEPPADDEPRGDEPPAREPPADEPPAPEPPADEPRRDPDRRGEWRLQRLPSDPPGSSGSAASGPPSSNGPGDQRADQPERGRPGDRPSPEPDRERERYPINWDPARDRER